MNSIQVHKATDSNRARHLDSATTPPRRRKTKNIIFNLPSAVSDSEGTKRKCTESINTSRNRSKH
jgi:hypothetical protein